MTIRIKILLFVIAIVVLMGSAGLIIGRTIASRALEDQAEDDLSAIAYSRAEAIENQLNYQKSSVETLAAQVSAYYDAVNSGFIDMGVGVDHFGAISQIMLGMVGTNPYVWQALWVDTAGNVIASSYEQDKQNKSDGQSPIDWDTVDYATIDWNGIDLAQVDWSKVDFSKIDVSNVDVGKIDYSKIDWSQIDPEDMGALDYSAADLSQVDWRNVDLSRVGTFDDYVSSEEFFQRGKEGAWVGNAAIYDGSTEFHMVAAAPFYSGGELAGVMAYVGGEDKFNQVITNHTGLGETGEVYLVNGDGYMLTPSRFADDVVLHRVVTLPQIPAGVKVTDPITRTSYMGDKVIGVYYQLPDTGWTVVVEKNRSEVLEPVSDLTRNIIWAMLALLAVCVILGIFFARAISAPIVKLKHGAEHIMQGDWDVDVATGADDEVGDLSRAFSAMTGKLQKSQQELTSYSHDLEEKVAELERAEAALRESEERYRLLAENATDVIWTMGMDFQFTYFSPSLYRLMGYTPQEYMTKSLEEMVTSQSLEHVMRLYDKELKYELEFKPERPRTITFELEQYRKDGSTIWTQAHTTFIRGSDGQPIGITGVTRDISGQRRAEETIRRERDRAQQYLDVAGVMLLIIDVDRKVQLINRKGCEILGYGEDEIIGKDWFEHFLPERIRSDVDEVAEVLESGDDQRFRYFENPILNSAGEERLIAWHNTVLRDEEGQVIGVLCSGEDITERKRAGEEIARLTIALDSVRDGAILVDETGRIRYVNEAYVNMLGYSREELLTHMLFDIAHNLDKNNWVDHWNEIVEAGGDILIETVNRAKDGRMIPVEVGITIFQIGGESYNIAMVRDITERKRAEKALQLTQYAIDRASIGCWWFDSEYRLIYVNDQGCRPLGYRPEEMIGMTGEDFDPDFNLEEMLPWEECLAIRSMTFETRHRRKDGSALPVEVTSNFIELDGQCYTFCFSKDITERKQAEEKVLTSLREKEVLLKEIHHRVKNNLQVISSLLNLQKASIADPQSQEMFDESGRRVRSMALIHEQLYGADDLSRIDFIQYVRQLVKRLVYSRGDDIGNVEVNIDGEDIFLDIDRAVPCGLIINELISNSFKYAFPPEWKNGEDAPRINIELTCHIDGCLRILVEDNGVGLPPDFDYRHSDTLGLQIVSSLADQLGAALELRLNGGTGFSITIPQTEADN